jgi:hypothetical protein
MNVRALTSLGRKDFNASVLVLGLSVIAVALGLSAMWIPAPLPPTHAQTHEFSAERAWQHVNAIAQKPRASGTEENHRVRAYLEAELSRLGLAVRVLPCKQGGIELGNIYGELPGTDGGRPAILLVSHYDSVPNGPGAADCASGVATLLETLRALRAGPPLRNSLALLLTDGEERRMTGAQAFIRDHSELWREIRVVLNLEARGNHGPVVMFESSPGAGRLIALLGKHCPYPIASSYSREIYRRLPNDTDFTAFLDAGCTGMNFAFIGGLEYYHSSRDTPENLSRRTLQHYGSCLLPLTAALGRAVPSELERLRDSGEATYFPLWRGRLVHYPQTFATALAWLTPPLFAIAIMRQRRFLRSGRIIGSLIIGFLALLLSAGLGFLVLKLLRRAYNPADNGLFLVGLPSEEVYLAMLVIAAAAITLGLNAWLLRRLHPEERLIGALIPWFGMTLVAAWCMPGAAYAFLWPTLLGIAALFLPAGEPTTGQMLLRAGLTAMPAPMLLAPTLYLMNQAVTIGIVPVSMGLVAMAFNLVCAPGLLRSSRVTEAHQSYS